VLHPSNEYVATYVCVASSMPHAEFVFKIVYMFFIEYK